MNINSLYGNNAGAPTGSVGAVSPLNARRSSIPAAPGGAATATISTRGQFFSELQQLSEQDPTKFKAVAAQLATSFQNAASQASGSQAKFLGNLANQFSQAAQTGSLQPPQTAQAPEGTQGSQAAGGAEPHQHRHHHLGAGPAGKGGPSSAVQQAFQSAMTTLSQAMQASTSGSSSPSAPTT